MANDLRFHQGLLRAGGNRMMVQMSKAIGALLRTSFEVSTTLLDGPASSLPLHRAVLDAVIAHKPEPAERASLKLIDSARDDIEQVLASGRRIKGLTNREAKRGLIRGAIRPRCVASDPQLGVAMKLLWTALAFVRLARWPALPTMPRMPRHRAGQVAGRGQGAGARATPTKPVASKKAQTTKVADQSAASTRKSSL